MAGRLLAVDPGERRLGIAVSDELGLIARPLGIVNRESWVRDLERLVEIIRQQAPSEVLIGHPVNVSGEPGPQARRAERLAGLLRQRVELPVRLVDERYSSLEARERLAASGKRRRPDAPIDAEAAAVILQRELDARR